MNPNRRERSKRSRLGSGSAVGLVAAAVRRLTSISAVGCRLSGLEVRASLRACCPSGIPCNSNTVGCNSVYSR